VLTRGLAVDRNGGHAGRVTTRAGISIVALGVAILLVRAVGWVDTEVLDIASVLAIVVGALAIAVDGETADQPTK
jgi:hypothetical protein